MVTYYIILSIINYAIGSDWLIENQFAGKAYLKINQLEKTPFHRGCMGVARSG